MNITAFILATTEKHKIIPTILSRCQIFDFKRIGVIDIKNYLYKIAEGEKVEAEDDALHIIAQKAENKNETGGLSGKPVKDRSTAVIRFLAENSG